MGPFGPARARSLNYVEGCPGGHYALVASFFPRKRSRWLRWNEVNRIYMEGRGQSTERDAYEDLVRELDEPRWRTTHTCVTNMTRIRA